MSGSQRTKRRIEIVHESLLTKWPRLVRWQTQDAEGAQLRDEVRQAAQVWEQHGRSEDYLWTGTAYRTYEIWRERYPGGLSTSEVAFAQAMEAGERRRRRRRRAAATTLIAAAVLVAVTTTVLWTRAVDSRELAEAESLRAEASKLVGLGEAALATYPTGALAYAITSLELADTWPGRLLASRALQQGPIARILAEGIGTAGDDIAIDPDFSPNGEWLAVAGFVRPHLFRDDGRGHVALAAYPSSGQFAVAARFLPESDVLATDLLGDVRFWSIPEGRELYRARIDEGPSDLAIGRGCLLTLTIVGERAIVREWPLTGGEPRALGAMARPPRRNLDGQGVALWDVKLGRLAFARGGRLYLRPTDDWSAEPRLVAEHPADILEVALGPNADVVAASDRSGAVRVWPTRAGSVRPLRVLNGAGTPALRFDASGRWLAAWGTADGRPLIRIWDLHGPSSAEPTVLWRSDEAYMLGATFDSRSGWFVTTHGLSVAFWWLGHARPQVLREPAGVTSLTFTPDGRSLISASRDGTFRLWSVAAGGTEPPRTLHRAERVHHPIVAIDPAGRSVAVSAAQGRIDLVPLDDRPVTKLQGFSSRVDVGALSFSPSGRHLAAAPSLGPREEKVVRVFDLETGDVEVLGPVPGAGDVQTGGTGAMRPGTGSLSFLDEERILLGVEGTGVVTLDRRTGAASVVAPWPRVALFLDHAGTAGIGVTTAEPGDDPENRGSWRLVRFRLDGSAPQDLRTHGAAALVSQAGFDRSDRILATASNDGIVRVGPATGEEPHLLLGHTGRVRNLAFSPDGRWLASGGEDGTIRIWPVPDVSRPPLHALPLDALLTRLRSHTNLRAVADPSSPDGYRLEPGPFPGWVTAPEG